MANLERKNSATIKRAFKRLQDNFDVVAEAGMKALLQNAMIYALTSHDQKHFGHRITRDSYGWLLLHDGRAVAHEVNEGRHGEGSAYSSLMDVSREVPAKGWIGILLASMEAETDHSSNIFFVVEYEQDILRETEDSLRSNFGKYFKKLAR